MQASPKDARLAHFLIKPHTEEESHSWHHDFWVCHQEYRQPSTILANLSIKLKLQNKPIGLDIESHKDKSEKIIFKKIDAINFVSKTKITFDLILIKQTIHLLRKQQILELLSICKKILSPNGKIIILSLDPQKNEIPTFHLMKKKLNISLKKDKRLFDMIIKDNPKTIIKKFIYSVRISKSKYLEMINNRYISTLLNFTDKEIINGLNEVIRKYKKILKFKDRLICFIIKK